MEQLQDLRCGRAIAKYNNRILEMKRGSASIAINGLTTNTRIAPVTSYVAQLVPLPKSFQEKLGCAVLLEHCMREADFFQLHKLGDQNSGPSQLPVQQLALFRTSLITVTSWPKWTSQLEICAKECLPVDQCFEGNHITHVLGYQPLSS